MIIQVSHNNQKYRVDTKRSIDISIPYNFNGAQPNFYDVKPGELIPLKFGEISYSVADGAGCNVPEISMNIHCTGTHTEHVGHLLEDPGDIGMVLKDILIPAVLITVNPKLFNASKESYHFSVNSNELVISAESISEKFGKWKDDNPQALIIRTLPNAEDKKHHQFAKTPPSFFTNDALELISILGIEHLIVDLPSIDRMSDNGILGNHRIFWGDGSNPKGEINPNSTKTITELTYIQDEVIDGFYFLNIQLPHFQCDAAPSRPILMKII